MQCFNPSPLKMALNNCISILMLLRGSFFSSITVQIPAYAAFVSWILKKEKKMFGLGAD